MSASVDERMLTAYDNTLLGILQNEAGLEPFLDVIFGFLCRRTDFYRIMKDPNQRYGFPEGVSENMVRTYFKKYQDLVSKAEKKAEEIQKSNQNTTPPVAKEETITTTSTKVNENVTLKSDCKKTETISGESNKSNKVANVVKIEETTPKKISNDQSDFQKDPDSYNGATRDKYSWTQNYEDIDVKIPVDISVTRGKQVKIEILRKSLKVCVENSRTRTYDEVINAELQHDVNKEESMWSLESGKIISITLTKVKSIWWTMLIKGEEEIDIQKICPERSMADMDAEEKAVINKLQFDERQKQLGLPQSHEMKVHEMLKKGWDAEDSPFKGQKFDPKMFNISPGAVGE